MIRRLRLRLTVICTLGTVMVLAGMAMASLQFSQRQLLLQSEEAFESSLNSIFFYLRGQSTVDYTWVAQTEAANNMLIRIEDKNRPMHYLLEGDSRRGSLTLQAQEMALRAYGFDHTRPPSGTLQPDLVRFQMTTEEDVWRVAVCAVPVQGGWLGVTVMKSTGAERQQLVLLRAAFVGCVVLASLALALFAWVFTGRAVRPVDESRRRQSEFIAAASHELRSPLAVMQASAGAMERASPERMRQFARTIEGECVRLSGLAEDLLTLTRADSRGWSIAMGEAEPETLLLSVAERYEPVAAQKQIAISTKLPEEPLPRLRCDPQRIGQLLAILVDNAVSYTPQGGRISLEVQLKKRQILFRVADSGPGVSAENRLKVFDRFYRGDAARSDRTHYGLGLSIAQEIVQLHRGEIAVEDAPGGGALFVVRLPL